MDHESMQVDQIIRMSESIDKIAPAFAAFQGTIANPKTTSDNPFFSSKYADLAEIWNTIRLPLSENGLSILQGVDVKSGAMSQTGELFDTVKIETYLLHLSGQFFKMILALQAYPKKQKGEKEGDYIYAVTPQVIGSCITYGRRYSISALLGIAQEDDDGNAASQNGRQPGKAQDRPVFSAQLVIKKLNEFYQDNKTTLVDVANFIKPIRAALERLSEAEQTEVRAVHKKLMERFEPKPPAETKAPEAETKAPAGETIPAKTETPPDEKSALTPMEEIKRASGIIEKMGAAKDIDELTAIMNANFQPVEKELSAKTKDLILKTYEGVVKKFSSERKGAKK